MLPGDTLVTITDYAAVPGAIFYDIVGAGDVAELAAAAAAGVMMVAAMSTTLAVVGAAAGYAAVAAPNVATYTMARLDTEIAGRIGLAAYPGIAA